MNISLAPERVLSLAGVGITNSMLTGWLVTALLLLAALLLRGRILEVPDRVQAFLELIYNGIFDLSLNVIGREEVVQELIPYLITLFFFIVVSSWVGLLPGVSSFGFHQNLGGSQTFVPLLRAPTTDLNAVIVLALFSVGYVQYLGVKYTGVRGYLAKFFNFSSPVNLAVGLLELVSEVTRLISYSFRLFGNIFAGEVLLSVMLFLTTTLLPFAVPLPLPFFFLETAVALVQAGVFCFLTIIFTALAIEAHADAAHAAEVDQHTHLTAKESA